MLNSQPQAIPLPAGWTQREGIPIWERDVEGVIRLQVFTINTHEGIAYHFDVAGFSHCLESSRVDGYPTLNEAIEAATLAGRITLRDAYRVMFGIPS